MTFFFFLLNTFTEIEEKQKKRTPTLKCYKIIEYGFKSKWIFEYPL